MLAVICMAVCDQCQCQHGSLKGHKRKKHLMIEWAWTVIEPKLLWKMNCCNCTKAAKDSPRRTYRAPKPVRARAAIRVQACKLQSVLSTCRATCTAKVQDKSTTWSMDADGHGSEHGMALQPGLQ